jgi:hypothetical protein
MREKISFLLCSLLLVTAAAFTHNAQAANAPKEWTFLVYLNGDNNLDSFGTTNINQMEAVGSSDKVNIIVQWASYENGKTQRLYIKKDGDKRKVTSPVIQDMGRVDMGNWQTLADFIKWGAQNYPAQHYLVDVWDHGSGWHAMQAMENGTNVFHPTDISWDDFSGNHITTKELGMALAQGAQAIGHKIDVYGSDACLMAMAEVASEMKNSVQYFVGSQDLEPGAGWPYDQIFARWANRSMSPRDVATMIAQEYTKSYQGGSNGNQEVTATAYDLSRTDALEQSIRALGAEMMKLDASGRAKVVSAAQSTAKFTYSDYGDLLDFVNRVDKQNLNLDRGALTQVQAAASQFIMVNTVTSSWSSKANGISFWLPSSKSSYGEFSQIYNDLSFQHDTEWSNALQYLVQDSNSDGGNGNWPWGR